MIDVEVLGTRVAEGLVQTQEVQLLCADVAARAGIHSGHVAIEFVDADRMAQLNVRYRNRPGPTDVLAFPIDGVEPIAGSRHGGDAGADSDAGADAGADAGLDAGADAGAYASADSDPAAGVDIIPRELGDVVICPQHATDVREAIVHGMLHLLGMDHETDDGEMLALQRELLLRRGA